MAIENTVSSDLLFTFSCTGWSAPFFFACNKVRFSCNKANNIKWSLFHAILALFNIGVILKKITVTGNSHNLNLQVSPLLKYMLFNILPLGLLELRNRSSLAVNCCVIIHCLEVFCNDQITSAQREWFIFVQLTSNSCTRADLFRF